MNEIEKLTLRNRLSELSNNLAEVNSNIQVDKFCEVLYLLYLYHIV